MCQPDATPFGISVSTCTISRPGIEDVVCCNSVRLSCPARASRGWAFVTASDGMSSSSSFGLRDGTCCVGEEAGELGGDLLRLVLDDEVTGGEPPAAHLVRPRT